MPVKLSHDPYTYGVEFRSNRTGGWSEWIELACYAGSDREAVAGYLKKLRGTHGSYYEYRAFRKPSGNKEYLAW